ncbi:ATP-binding protein [Streptomyces sp. SHP 1-2]|uniref:sensor histidine kinase n=1 Tax=Streptomyces sp. SHP 1-2 TaxID=2769489 RepID=UPI0039E0299A
MSHLRAPAARADRREGGRHGRPAARTAPALPETHIRPQLLRLAVLPPIAVALGGCAAVLFTVRSTDVRPAPALWAVLAGAVSLTLAAVAIAAIAADRAARSVRERVGALRRDTVRDEGELRAVVEAMRRGEGPPPRTPRGGPPQDADDFDLLAGDLARAHDGALTAVVEAAQLSSQTGSEQKLEVFVNLARRLQSLVHREISILDELENAIEDPDLLKGLFHVDHLATRVRRHAENLAVLGGAVSRRQWSNPVDMTEVLRSAIAEVEQYSRVRLVPPIDGTLRGHAVADVIHLLAELIENATVFSAPHTPVLLRAGLVTSGLAVEVEDRGLGMPVDEQHRMNALLADPDQVNAARMLADGRIGLYVVSMLARRHGITVRVQSNIYGGVQAVLVLPQDLLGAAATGPADGLRPEEARGAGLGAGASAEAAVAVAPPVEPRPAVPPTAAAQRPAGEGPAGEGRAGHPAAGPDTAGRDGPAPHVPPLVSPGDDGAPSRLPVRGSRRERSGSSAAVPSAAVPSVSAPSAAVPSASVRETRSDGAGGAGGSVGPGGPPAAPPTPRGLPDGSANRPRLPRRRAREHLVPQLRGGPVARQEPRPEHPAGHDPGLMAAFRRGIGLAEARQTPADTDARVAPAPGESPAPGPRHPSVEPAPPSPLRGEPRPPAPGCNGSGPIGPEHTGGGDTGPRLAEYGEPDPGHVDPDFLERGPLAPGRAEPGPLEQGHGEPGLKAEEPGHGEPGPMESGHGEPGPMESGHGEPSPMESGHLAAGCAGSGHLFPAPREPRHPEPSGPGAGPAEPGRSGPRPLEPRPAEPLRAEPRPLEPRYREFSGMEPRAANPRPLEALPGEPRPADPRHAAPRPQDPGGPTAPPHPAPGPVDRTRPGLLEPSRASWRRTAPARTTWGRAEDGTGTGAPAPGEPPHRGAAGDRSPDAPPAVPGPPGGPVPAPPAPGDPAG